MRIDPIMEAGLQYLRVREGLRTVTHQDDGSPRPYEERRRRLMEFKQSLKKRFREQALDLHPDANAGLPPEEKAKKEETFKAISRAMELVEKIEVRPPQPPMQPFRVVIIPTTGFGSPTTNTSSTTTFAWGWTSAS